jgi:hypothetical protein
MVDDGDYEYVEVPRYEGLSETHGSFQRKRTAQLKTSSFPWDCNLTY